MLPSGTTIKTSTCHPQTWSVLTVLQATFSNRKTNRLVFPVLLAISSQQKALQVAQSAQVATTKLRAVSNHASNVAAAQEENEHGAVVLLKDTA
jgi:hypothetical protein